MPLFGTLDLDAALATAPTVDGLDPDTWSLPGAETLQVSFEVAEGPALAVTPPGLHPSIPPYVTFSVTRFPESPVGPFRLAMVRLIVRAGIRPRGLLVKGFVDSEAAADGLRRGWGYDVSVAEVSLARRHDRITGSVTIDGEVALEAVLDDPEPVAGADLELFDNLHLVNVAGGEPLIVQVDPGYEYRNADRGGAGLPVFRAEALGIVGIEPVYGVVGVACTADMELAAPRFVIDPSKPAIQGTRRLDRSST
jgi:hypothetical protein